MRPGRNTIAPTIDLRRNRTEIDSTDNRVSGGWDKAHPPHFVVWQSERNPQPKRLRISAGFILLLAVSVTVPAVVGLQTTIPTTYSIEFGENHEDGYGIKAGYVGNRGKALTQQPAK